MRTFSRPMTLRPVMLIIAPLLMLTVLFGLLMAAILMSGKSAYVSGTSILVAGVLIYGATLFVLSVTGVSSIRELEDLGRRDGLSGLANRHALHQDFARSVRRNPEAALALIDLDGFKQVNDHLGHFVGDQVIRHCAAMLKEICGKDARCYRLGGDEFAILVHGPVAGTILEGICRNFIDELEAPVPIGDRRLAIGASIGLAGTNEVDSLSSSELLRRADVAMYASKRFGRMRSTWYDEDFDRDREAVQELDDELRQALANDEFALVYQPLVDAKTQAIVAVEALIRWNRPDGKAVGPHVFIPVAEETGMINPIGLWVLRKACEDALDWAPLAVSVNISAAQLRNAEFPVKLGQILEETGFPAERLELEITETFLVMDSNVAERSLEIIRGFGVKVALDDFGTGYASIGFLRQFRFEKLKLDRSLVVDAGEDEGSRAMMLSSVTLARALKMGVAAEGVETTEQAEMAKAAGCDQIQGWLYYKAMPPQEVSELLAGQSEFSSNPSHVNSSRGAQA
ncbi:putative bifunctional diguanylate cyclase/phosphodiesterase [Altererythrobacter lutimaris]